MSNQCPNCNSKINNKDKFCKECGEKIEIGYDKGLENKKQEKNKKGNKNIRLAFILIMLQKFFYITGLITGNFSFKINSGDDISVFIGYNIFLIIAIILLLKNKKEVKSNLKRNMIFIIIIIVLLITTIVINQTGVTLEYNQTSKDIINDKAINKKVTKNSKDKTITINCFYFLTDDYEIANQIIDELDKGTDIEEVVEKYDGESWYEVINRRDIIEEFSAEYSKLETFEYSVEPLETVYGYYVIYKK